MDTSLAEAVSYGDEESPLKYQRQKKGLHRNLDLCHLGQACAQPLPPSEHLLSTYCVLGTVLQAG